jgi:lipopolysaccharide transport system ATP-binding protein
MKPSIEMIHVTKRYRIGQAPLSFKALFSRGRQTPEEQFHWAVNDVNFALRPGESLGVIGPNGAGKTTILKLLSKVTMPTTGEIRMNGRFSALIELGAGFHPDLTGRENVYLNGTILGMTRAEIDDRFEDIVAFAGIGKYLDTPVKRYSSGMYARLGFAVAAHVDPDILLVDEVLAVGDMAFQQKCYDRMLGMLEKGTTLIFVSHNMGAVQRVCQQCIVMYRGQVAFVGATAQATAEYSNILRQAAAEQNANAKSPVQAGLSQRVMTQTAVIEDVKIIRDSGETAEVFSPGEEVCIKVRVKAYEFLPSPILACTIRSPEGAVVYDFTTHWAKIDTPDFESDSVFEIVYRLKLNLVNGIYQLGVDLAYHDLSRYYDRLDRALDFVITGGSGARGYADLEASVEVNELQRE